jgi:hypothetical protein
MQGNQKKPSARAEADLEARIRSVLARVFPTLPDESLEHQTQFSFNVGSKEIIVDGELVSRVDARSDILIRHNGVPLAVLELKRTGRKLSDADDRQGLSYASMLTPRPPLVIVTNGEDVRVLQSHSGELWEPAEKSETAVQELFENASRVAAYDTRRALDILLGAESGVWAPAIRATTDTALQELYGEWEDQLSPFVSEFLIPRTATGHVLELLRKGKRLVLLEGAPLMGKSNVLRDLAARTQNGDAFALLYLEADTGADSGIFYSLAGHLRTHLDWPMTPREVRTWLVTLSHRTGGGKGPTLILAIDGMNPDQDKVRRDIEDLSTSAFGPGVGVVVAVDDSVAEILASGKRAPTKIGRRAKRVAIKELDDAEFNAALVLLARLRLGVMHGGRWSAELRVPWILRAIVAPMVEEAQQEDESLKLMIPPLVGIEIVDLARHRFGGHQRLRAHMRDVGRAVLDESEDPARSVSMRLLSALVFVVSRGALRRNLSDRIIEELVVGGSLRLVFPQGEDSEPFYVVKLPELLAATLARLVEEGFVSRVAEDPCGAADWLVERATSFPLGEVIAARALVDFALKSGVPEEVVLRLSEHVPTTEPLKVGARYALPDTRGRVHEMHVDADGALVDSATGGRRVRISREVQEENHSLVHGNLHGWLILSHLAGVPMVGWGSDEPPSGGQDTPDERTRIDPALLALLLDNPFPLRPVVPDHEQRGIRQHHLPDNVTVICHLEGIVEPVTLSVFRFLGASGAAATSWIEQTIAAGSIPTAMRLDIALRNLAQHADAQRSSWAKDMLRDHVWPILADAGLLH